MRYRVEIVVDYDAESDAEAVTLADELSDAVFDHDLCRGLVTNTPERYASPERV